LTGYDEKHIVTYLRLLADANGVEWTGAARVVLHSIRRRMVEGNRDIMRPVVQHCGSLFLHLRECGSMRRQINVVHGQRPEGGQSLDKSLFRHLFVG
jgi:hypothetical protein